MASVETLAKAERVPFMNDLPKSRQTASFRDN
jgi:hypothetical protein